MSTADRENSARESPATSSCLEYCFAFDLAAAFVQQNVGAATRVAVVASSPVFVREWLLRTSGPSTIIAESPSVAVDAQRLVDSMVTPTSSLAIVIHAERSSELAEGQFSAAIWSSPQPGTWQSLVEILVSTLASGAPLVVLTAGHLGWLLGGIRRHSSTGEARRPIRGIVREIERRGHRIEDTFAIGGLDTIGWAALARAANVLRRPDLADRFEAGYRLALVPRRGRQTGFFTLIAARKTRDER